MASESSLRREYAPVEEKGGAEDGARARAQTGTNGSEYALYSPMEESENKPGNGVGVETGVAERTESGNILDDMDKFQREIDELRHRYKQAG